MAQITLNKGGRIERTIDAQELPNVPDLWHIADWLEDEAVKQGNKALEIQAEAIRECWHLAHDLRRHAQESRPDREPDTEHALSWANQQSYAFAGPALDKYCEPRGLSWSADAMYSFITFEVKP